MVTINRAEVKDFSDKISLDITIPTGTYLTKAVLWSHNTFEEVGKNILPFFTVGALTQKVELTAQDIDEVDLYGVYKVEFNLESIANPNQAEIYGTFERKKVIQFCNLTLLHEIAVNNLKYILETVDCTEVENLVDSEQADIASKIYAYILGIISCIKLKDYTTSFELYNYVISLDCTYDTSYEASLRRVGTSVISNLNVEV